MAPTNPSFACTISFSRFLLLLLRWLLVSETGALNVLLFLNGCFYFCSPLLTHGTGHSCTYVMCLCTRAHAMRARFLRVRNDMIDHGAMARPGRFAAVLYGIIKHSLVRLVRRFIFARMLQLNCDALDVSVHYTIALNCTVLACSVTNLLAI